MQQIRKFSLSKLLHGMAHVCNNIGNATVAETKQEKQQAALGVVGSMLNLAGDMSEKEEQEENEKSRSLKKVVFVDTSADFINQFIEDIDWQEIAVKRDVKTFLLDQLVQIKTKHARKKAILEKLQTKATRKVLWKEVFTILKEFGESQFVPLVASLMQDIGVQLDHLVNRLNRNIRVEGADGIDGVDGEEEVSEDVVDLLKAIWNFAMDILEKEKGVATYVKEQFFLLLDYLYDEFLEDSMGDYLEDVIEDVIRPDAKQA